MQEEQNRKKEAGLELAKREADVLKATAVVEQGRLRTLEQQRDRREQTSEALGNMTAGERGAAASAVHRLRQFGWEALSPWERGQVRQVFPEEARKAAVGAGEQARGALGLGGGVGQEKPLDQVDTNIEQVRQNIKKIQDEAEKTLAKAIQPALEAFTAAIAQTMKDQIDAVKKDVDVKLANLNKGGGR